VSGGPEPSYQVINSADKKMAFDRNHHLLPSESNDFAGANATPIFSLDQVKALIAGIGIGSSSRSRTTRVVRATGPSRTAQVKLHDQFAAQRYEYFKNNRQNLPPTISEHSDEIADLMKVGKSAEEAFNEVVKKYF